MIVELSSIGNVAKPIDLTIPPDEIDLDGARMRIAGNAEFHGETQRLDGKAHVRGKVTAEVEASCSRCLEPVIVHIDEAFDDVFVDASEETTTAEIEVTDRDLDESLVIGGNVDIAEVVREQLLLAVPEHVLCGEDCKGLCAKCGGNLNLIDCNCADEEIDPRWAALKNLN